MWNPFSRNAEPSDPQRRAPDNLAAFARDPSFEPPRSDIAEVKMVGNVAVATLTVTELSQDQGAAQLAELLLELADTGAHHFVLDVQNVQFMDTTCVGCLVEALNRLAINGGQIALASPNQGVHYVFRLTRLDRVFRICSDVMSALTAVEGRREAG